MHQLEKALAASRTEANSALSKASAADRERLESENALRGAVSELEEQLHQASQRLQDVNLNLQETDERLRAVLRDNDSLKEENLILRRASNRKSEASHGKDAGSVRRTSAYYEDDVFDKLERERALRKNAEDIAVSLAQRLKADGSNTSRLRLEISYDARSMTSVLLPLLGQEKRNWKVALLRPIRLGTVRLWRSLISLNL